MKTSTCHNARPNSLIDATMSPKIRKTHYQKTKLTNDKMCLQILLKIIPNNKLELIIYFFGLKKNLHICSPHSWQDTPSMCPCGNSSSSKDYHVKT